jgi:hypothetical protein
MHPQEPVLEKLKAIRHDRADTSPFSNHSDFLLWSDRAEPLLSFNSELAEEFKRSVRAATAVRDWRPEKYDGAVNGAVGAVNKAITLLEVQIASAPKAVEQETTTLPLAAPEKLTVKWLYEHAPWSFYVWLVGALSAAFTLGFTASEFRTAGYSKNVASSAPATTVPTTASPQLTAVEPAASGTPSSLK